MMSLRSFTIVLAMVSTIAFAQSSTQSVGFTATGTQRGIDASGGMIGVNGVGNNVGIYGVSVGPGGYGVFGNNTSFGIGVYGTSPQGGGVQGSGQTGVQGLGTFYGVNGSGAVADFFSGGLGVSFVVGTIRNVMYDIAPITDPMAEINQLQGVMFTWPLPSPNTSNARSGRPDIGFIAEEVAKVVPEVVAVDPNAQNVAVGIDYARLTVLLVEAVKQQAVDITMLKTANAKLQRQIESCQVQVNNPHDLARSTP